MNSFNPLNYSELSESIIDVSGEMVEKGHKNNVKVDMEKFEEMCKGFREKKDLKIKKLSGEDKKNFDLVVNYVHMLYGTPFYKKLFERVRKHFKNVNGSKPGTIGSYFSGCMNAVSDKEHDMLPGCTVACAGSMPLPSDEDGWSFCDKAVIIGERQDDSYVFSIVKPAENDEDYDPCYVFVEGEFSGLSRDEKKSLIDLGCGRIKLISYNGDDYTEIYEKDVSEIEERIQNAHDSKSDTDSKNKTRETHKTKHRHHERENDESSKFWIFIVFLLLIILLLFLVYRYYKMKYLK